MVVTLLEAFHYPRREEWRSIKTAEPDWAQIEASVDRLDRFEWPFIWLHTEPPAESEMPNNMLCIMGGRDEYSLCLNRDGDEIEFIDSSRKNADDTIRIWESDQGLERSLSQLCNDRFVVLRIVRVFCESGELDLNYEWRSV